MPTSPNRDSRDDAHLASEAKIPAQQQEQKPADSSDNDDMETQEAELLLSTALRAEASACYTSNSAKEEACLVFVQNFSRQFRALYSMRRPLLLVAPICANS
jgi:hypothetical protein